VKRFPHRTRRRTDTFTGTRTSSSRYAVFLLCSMLFGLRVTAQVPEECYRIETLEPPPGISPAVTALAFDSEGRLLSAFRRGSIWSLDTSTGAWQPFANGLLWPLGMVCGAPGEVFVVQTPELTRVVDTDRDGTADLYETICDLWGISGNYHEFAYGPVRDADGNFFVGLGLASAGGPTREPLRGRPPPIQPPDKPRGHHSPVPYRGWIVKISPTGTMTPFASGFRQPNGLVFNPTGDLFSVDNQGDWKGTSPLYHITEGGFYGHPASLVWSENSPVDPAAISAETVAKQSRPAAVEFPQNDMAGSTAQPVLDTTGGKFGPYAGQLIVADWTHPRLYRVSLEKLDGEYQGACYPFIENGGLTRGNLRLAFAPDGSLYVGQCSLPWFDAPEGLKRVVWTGKTPMDILRMSLRADGFELTFTKPLAPSGATIAQNYSLQHYFYRSTREYGSPRHESTPVPIERVEVLDDGLRVRLFVGSIAVDRIYDLRTRGLHGTDGEPLVTSMAAYTVRRLRR